MNLNEDNIYIYIYNKSLVRRSIYMNKLSYLRIEYDINILLKIY